MFKAPVAMPTLIETRRLDKSFGSVHALHQVSLAFVRGEVHGLIGENGAGKSTLMRILAGLVQPDGGQVFHRDKPLRLKGPGDALARGIVMIHQELNLVDELTVADNIFLGREPTRGGIIDRQAMRQRSGELLADLHAQLDPDTFVKDLSIGQQQMVEIVKAMSQDASLLIVDEPTAALSGSEARLLFSLIARLKARGTTIIYISHILPEVLAVCDRITVLRDGQVVTTLDRDQLTGETRDKERHLAGLMVGRPMGDHFPPRQRAGDQSAIELRGISLPGLVHGVSLSIKRGEILGLAGLIGAGRTELAEAVVGLRRRSGGEILIEGRPVVINTVRDAVRLGLAYLSEDRRGRGLLMGMSITANITMVSLRRYCRPLISPAAEHEAVASHRAAMGIRMGQPSHPIESLSGGNQQKVALAKWLEISPRVLILDEPTRGVDIGAKEEIYNLIVKLAAQGMACLLISSEINEVLGLSHRVAVMRQGRLMAVMDVCNATEKSVMYHAAGVDAVAEATATVTSAL